MLTTRRTASPVLALALFTATLAAAASGEVVDAADNGFTIRLTAALPADASAAYAAAVDIGKWWDPQHTYSGDGANLTLDPKPGGCLCERLPDGGGVRHMTVVFASPGKTLRLAGGLGPLQSLGAAGAMTWTFKPAEKGTSVEVRYAVGGYVPGGFKDLAAAVDGVLGAQVERYRAYVSGKKPGTPTP